MKDGAVARSPRMVWLAMIGWLVLALWVLIAAMSMNTESITAKIGVLAMFSLLFLILIPLFPVENAIKIKDGKMRIITYLQLRKVHVIDENCVKLVSIRQRVCDGMATVIMVYERSGVQRYAKTYVNNKDVNQLADYLSTRGVRLEWRCGSMGFKG